MTGDVFDQFPEFAAVSHDTTGDIVLITKGRTGYWPMPEGMTPHQINEGTDMATLEVMKILSILGWERDLAVALLGENNGR